jgi:HEAT repeat protein
MAVILVFLLIGFGPAQINAPQSLAAAMDSTDVVVRRNAVNEAAKRTTLSLEELTTLRIALKDGDDIVSRRAASVLANAGVQAVHEIDLALQDDDPPTRDVMLSALGQAKRLPPEVWPLLIRSFKDKDFWMQVSAAQALAHAGPAVLPLLKRALQDTDSRVRTGTCETVRQLGAQAISVLPQLLKLLNDSEMTVRFRAAAALPALDPTQDQVVPILVPGLEDPNFFLRNASEQALGLVGPRALFAVPTLLKQLTNPDSAVRRGAASTLGKIRFLTPADMDKMAAALHHQDPLTRSAVVDALGQLDPSTEAVIPLLTEALHDATSYVADDAAIALGHSGERALPAVMALFKDSDFTVRKRALDALSAMKPLPQSAVPILISLVDDRSTLVSDSAAGVLLQAGIRGEWLTKYQTIQQNRKALAQEQAAREAEDRLYSKEEIIQDIPPDDDHKFPLQVDSMQQTKGRNGVPIVVTRRRGKDRPDRITIWKQDGDLYRRLNIMQVEDAEIASYELPDIFRYNGDNFIHITLVYSGTAHSVTESVFAIRSDNTLAEVLFPNIVGEKVQLKPGEGVWKGVSTRLSDDKLEFEYFIWNEGDANCCPTAGSVTGTLKVSKQTRLDETGHALREEWIVSVDTAVRHPVH